MEGSAGDAERPRPFLKPGSPFLRRRGQASPLLERPRNELKERRHDEDA